MLRTLRQSDTEAIETRILGRGKGDFSAQQKVVDEILRDVREVGDAALFAYTRKFDRFDVNEKNIEVTAAEKEAAMARVEQAFLEIMEEAAANIREFHDRQRREDWFIERADGAVLGQLYLPVERAGVYVPGGKASYPSSVLMNIIPAKCAGVPEIFVATPAVDGRVPDATVAAAVIAGADRIFKMGGAQAVAAFAYGTRSIPKADKITGPGNIYVSLAKKSVFGTVGIDMIAGPSEVLVIADKSADPAFVAADFLSQAEHDELAASILVTDDEGLAGSVSKEVERQTARLPRREIVQKSLENYGTVILCENMDGCVEIANKIAPEHLEILTEDPQALAPHIRNAGSIFLGAYSPEPLGDYFAGANHILPTNGTARFSSPLNVDDFQKKSSVIYYTKEAFRDVYKKVAAFAENEGLAAHAASARIRFEG